MILPDEAFRHVIAACCPLPAKEMSLGEAAGLRLAEDISADRDFPPFNRATMDGFAVRVAEAGKSVPVAGEIPAGVEWAGSWSEGTCLEIMTGAACPAGVEAVVQKEDVRREGDMIVLPVGIKLGANIARQGSECRSGRIVLSAGQTITPLAVAVAAAVGRTRVRVIPRPSLAIIVTGEELMSEGEVPRGAKIRDSNGPMLAALAKEADLHNVEIVHARDNRPEIFDALEKFTAVDILLLSGGVSAGKYDLGPGVVQEWGGEAILHRVMQKPGKPLFFARRENQLIFGLPGNPLGCHFCFERYVAAAMDVLQGKNPRSREFLGTLNSSVRNKGERTHFVAARCDMYDATPGTRQVAPLPTVSSADIFSCTEANCFIEVPPREDAWPAGSKMQCHWFAKYAF
jgi:molybdopterin molybdotransferase